MNLKSICSTALGVTLSCGVMAVSTPGQTQTTKDLMPAQFKTKTILLAQSTNLNSTEIEASVHKQINAYRRSLGLGDLQRNTSMDNQARNHSRNMANGVVGFGHTGFSERIRLTGIAYRGAAENVAYNMGYSDPATKAVQGWIKSPGHLRNIKGNYNLTGIGVAINSRGYVYLTQLFILTR